MTYRMLSGVAFFWRLEAQQIFRIALLSANFANWNHGTLIAIGKSRTGCQPVQSVTQKELSKFTALTLELLLPVPAIQSEETK